MAKKAVEANFEKLAKSHLSHPHLDFMTFSTVLIAMHEPGFLMLYDMVWIGFLESSPN